MIKIETEYNNDLDQLTWSYESEHSHTMEHLAVIQNLFDLIIKNDPNYNSYREVYKEIKRVRQDLINKEDTENE